MRSGSPRAAAVLCFGAMKSQGGSSPVSFSAPARQRFRVIAGGLAESGSDDGIVIRLFSPVPDDEPGDLPAPPESFLRSSLGRAVMVSAGLHVLLLALILLAWMPQSAESVPISVTLIWEPAPAPPAEPAPPATPPQVAETAAPAPASEEPAAADPAPALPPPQLTAIEPAAQAPAAPEPALPPPPPRRPPTPARATPTPAAAPTPAKPAEALPGAPVAAASVPPQTAALPLIPPRPVSGAAGNAVPDYPAAARRQRLQGKVVLQVEVSTQGSAGKITVLTSSGHRELDDAAVSSVRKWRFVPASRGGEAVPATAEIPIQFRLAD